MNVRFVFPSPEPLENLKVGSVFRVQDPHEEASTFMVILDPVSGAKLFLILDGPWAFQIRGHIPHRNAFLLEATLTLEYKAGGDV